MSNTFDYQVLSLALLRWRIAPRRVRGIVHELRGHFLDLHVASRDQGMSQSEADAWAASKLGNDGDVAREVLSRPELQSWELELNHRLEDCLCKDIALVSDDLARPIHKQTTSAVNSTKSCARNYPSTIRGYAQDLFAFDDSDSSKTHALIEIQSNRVFRMCRNSHFFDFGAEPRIHFSVAARVARPSPRPW